MKIKIREICEINNRKLLDYFGFSSMLALIRVDTFSNMNTLEQHVDLLLRYLKYIRKDFDRAICRVDNILASENNLLHLTRLRYSKDQLEKIQKQLHRVKNGLTIFKYKHFDIDISELKDYLKDIEQLVKEFGKLEDYIEW